MTRSKYTFRIDGQIVANNRRAAEDAIEKSIDATIGVTNALLKRYVITDAEWYDNEVDQ